MATLDSLPPDERAVLQLVLQRGRSYDEIARLLSMNRASVRDRALRAFDALGPETGVGDQRRALITDYLLGQLPPAVTTQVRDHLAQSPSERAWARVLAAELAPLTARSLPEIPSEGAVNRGTTAGPPAPVPPAADDKGKGKGKGKKQKKERQSILLRRRRNRESSQPARAAEPMPPSKVPDVPDRAPRSSRLGGALLLILAAVIVAAVVVVVLASGGSSPKPHPAAAASSTTSTGTSPTTSTGSASVVSKITMTAAKPGSKAVGIAEVLKEGKNEGIAIVAQNVAPNSTKPPNAYAVWLYNSAHDAYRLGFVNPGVGSNGKLSTAGGLPSNASHFKRVIVTIETTAHPTSPGTIVLQGALTGL